MEMEEFKLANEQQMYVTNGGLLTSFVTSFTGGYLCWKKDFIPRKYQPVSYTIGLILNIVLSFKGFEYLYFKFKPNLKQQMIKQYNFTYAQYVQALEVMERADRVKKLDKLIIQQDNFEWFGIPTLQEMRDKEKEYAKKFVH